LEFDVVFHVEKQGDRQVDLAFLAQGSCEEGRDSEEPEKGYQVSKKLDNFFDTVDDGASYRSGGNRAMRL